MHLGKPQKKLLHRKLPWKRSTAAILISSIWNGKHGLFAVELQWVKSQQVSVDVKVKYLLRYHLSRRHVECMESDAVTALSPVIWFYIWTSYKLKRISKTMSVYFFDPSCLPILLLIMFIVILEKKGVKKKKKKNVCPQSCREAFSKAFQFDITDIPL